MISIVRAKGLAWRQGSTLDAIVRAKLERNPGAYDLLLADGVAWSVGFWHVCVCLSVWGVCLRDWGLWCFGYVVFLGAWYFWS